MTDLGKVTRAREKGQPGRGNRNKGTTTLGRTGDGLRASGRGRVNLRYHPEMSSSPAMSGLLAVMDMHLPP
ncbi:hypothetical protein GCM10020220_046790 [Nonomuraea rubra]